MGSENKLVGNIVEIWEVEYIKEKSKCKETNTLMLILFFIF